MQVEIKKTITIDCAGSWPYKGHACIFVKTPEDRTTLLEKLIEQDDYWEDYPECVRVLPDVVTDVEQLQNYCRYTGKTDIYDMDKLKKTCGVDFMIVTSND